jgi:ABC-type branched-subunit amino acid transport system ATPase component
MDALLSVRNLTIHFGGLKAVEDVVFSGQTVRARPRAST